MADETGAPIRMQQDAATAKTLLSSALLGELNRRVLDYENSIDWMTSCTGCANLLDRSVEEMFRREQAEEKLAGVRDVLRAHYLAQVICDHEGKRDNPVCACSLVNLGWHPSVGTAVEAWIDHVLAIISGEEAGGTSDCGQENCRG